MRTITNLMTNGNKINLYISEHGWTNYRTFEWALETMDYLPFATPTIAILPNNLVLKYNVALKLANKLKSLFEIYGYIIHFDIKDDDGEAKFDVMGDSKIEISKTI